MLKHLFIGLCVFVFWGALAIAQEKPDNTVDEMKIMKQEALAWNKVCPLDGKPVNQDIANVEFNEKNYGFCGEKCAELFKSDPKLYSKNLSEDGTKLVIQTEGKAY